MILTETGVQRWERAGYGGSREKVVIERGCPLEGGYLQRLGSVPDGEKKPTASVLVKKQL